MRELDKKKVEKGLQKIPKKLNNYNVAVYIKNEVANEVEKIIDYTDWVDYYIRNFYGRKMYGKRYFN